MGYQGHRNYNAWNICLYVMNEEPLYRRAVELCRMMSKRAAAQQLFNEITECSDKTPDGVPWTLTNIRLALQGDF